MEPVKSDYPRDSVVLPQVFDTSCLPEVYHPCQQAVFSPVEVEEPPTIEGTIISPTRAEIINPLPPPRRPWWRRYWVLFLVIPIVAAGITVGCIEGIIATQRNTDNSRTNSASGLSSKSSSMQRQHQLQLHRPPE